jgi:hypothetical protein
MAKVFALQYRTEVELLDVTGTNALTVFPLAIQTSPLLMGLTPFPLSKEVEISSLKTLKMPRNLNEIVRA